MCGKRLGILTDTVVVVREGTRRSPLLIAPQDGAGHSDLVGITGRGKTRAPY